MGWCEPGLLQSIPVCVNPNGGMNCYWQMPFRNGARITLENLTDKKSVVYYQITYSQTHVAEDTPYFHAPVSYTPLDVYKRQPGNDVRPDGADLRSPSCEEGLLVREAQKQK